MEKALNKNIFLGVKLLNNGHFILHLKYTNDTGFYGSWSIDNVRNLIQLLKHFKLSSSLNINMCKSRLFGFVVKNHELDLVARSFNFCNKQPLFMYMGLPVASSMSRTEYWNPIVKFCCKLSKSKASNLLIGGLFTLYKATLDNLGTYFFSLYKALSKVLKNL